MKSYWNLLMTHMRKQPLMTALVLLIVFPPIGIFYMFVLGGKEIYRTIKARKAFPFDSVTLLFIIMFLSSIGAALQEHQWSYLAVSLSIIGFYGVYLFTITQHKVTQIKYFSSVIIFGGIYQCVFGLLSQFLFQKGWTNTIIGYLTGSQLLGFLSHSRLYGSAYNPNYSAFLLVFAMGFLLAEILKVVRTKTFKRLYLFVSLLAIIIAGINATGSRSGFVAMLFLFGIFLFRLSWKLTIVLFTLVLLNGFWLYQYIPRSYDILDNFSTRVFIWKNSIELTLQYPQFGLTPLGFPEKYFNQTGHQAAHAHNIFLAFFADFGIIAGFVFIGLTAAVMFNFIKLLKYNRSKALFDWFLFSMPILCLTGLLDFPLSSPQIALPALILVSMWQQYIGRTNHSFKHWQSLLQQKKVPDPS